MKVTSYLVVTILFVSSWALLGHAHLTCWECDGKCRDINDDGVEKECDEGAKGCLYSEHHGMIDSILTVYQINQKQSQLRRATRGRLDN